MVTRKSGWSLGFICLVGIFSTPVRAANSINEDFNSSQASPLLNIPLNYNWGPRASPPGSIYRTTKGHSGRNYVITTASDYNSVDFRYDLDFTMNGRDGMGLLFMGIGSGQPNSAFFQEPDYSAYFLVWPSEKVFFDVASGWDLTTGPQGAIPIETGFGPAPRDGQLARARIEKIGNAIMFSYQMVYAGGPYVPDYTISKNITSLPFLDGTNSHLFFGTDSDSSTVDNLTITMLPEPVSLSFFGLVAVLLSRRR